MDAKSAPAPADSRDPGGRLGASLEAFVFAALFCLALAFGSALSNRDGDLGRHLAMGREILDSGHLPTTDTFSYTAYGRALVPHEWLSEIFFASVERRFGFDGVGIACALLIALAWSLAARLMLRRGIPPMAAAPAAFLGALTTGVQWMARPHLFSFVLLTIAVHLLEQHRAGRTRSLWFLVPLTALWANLHGGFITGLVLQGSYLAGAAPEALTDARKRPAALRLAACLGLSTIAAMANPVGPRLLTYSFHYLGERELHRITLEYNSPDFHHPLFLPFLAMMLLFLAFPPRRTPVVLAVLAIWTTFALYAYRNVAFYAVVAAPHLAEAFALARLRPARPSRRMRFGRTTAFGLAAIVCGAAVLATVRHDGPSEFGFLPSRFPVEAAHRFCPAPPGERVFNQYSWGGYLLSACPHQVKVFIDGQNDFYGRDITMDYEAIANGAPGWEELLEKYRVDWAMVRDASPIAQLLRLSSGWRELYSDSTAAVFSRSVVSPGTAPAAPP
jgi:hypothetical protein